MQFYRKFVRRGVFSALEVAVVVVIVGVVGAIVGPRMSRGAAAASSPQLAEQVLAGRLKSLREAIGAYAEEHGGRPPDGPQIEEQLTQFTDWSGNVSPTKTRQYRLGPYLREIPPLPVGQNRSVTRIRLAKDPATLPAGWTYDPRSGTITAATRATESDDLGRPFAGY
jgi:type II secretory pathway pseudopilin PulG